MFVDFVETTDYETMQSAAEAWLTESRATNASRTVLRRAASLSNFSRMFELGIDLDDYRLPTPPPAYPTPLPNLYQDLDKMIELANGNVQRGLVALGGLGGLRISETLSIRPSWIDIATKKMEVTGKGGKVRIIPISSRLWQIILPLYIGAKTTDSPLVPLEDRNARGIVSRIAKRAGLKDVSSHDLRATYATMVFRKTKDVRIVQYLLGHASINTTQVYLGIDHAGAVEAVEFDDE